jgi:hypothetical protein
MGNEKKIINCHKKEEPKKDGYNLRILRSQVDCLKEAFPHQPAEWSVEEMNIHTNEYVEYAKHKSDLPRYEKRQEVMKKAGLNYRFVKLYEGHVK